MFTEQQLTQYRASGYCVLENFKSLNDCQQLRQRAQQIVENSNPEDMRVFTTVEQARNSDDYFLSSGDKIRCFYEEKAINEKGELTVDKNVAINKLGHAMHELDPVFRAFSADPRLEKISQQIGQHSPCVLQSMYIFKQPHIGGEVNIHQDSTFLYTDPMSCIGFWFALEKATLENGCLWGLPAGHKQPLEKVMSRAASGNGVSFAHFNDNHYDEKDFVPLEVDAGTLIIFDGRFPHFSHANTSSKTRHAFTLHTIDACAEYPSSNWLQREDGAAFPSFSQLRS